MERNVEVKSSVVRIEQKTRQFVLMTRIGTRREYPMRARPDAAAKQMRPGQVWRVRWHSAGIDNMPEWGVLIEATPIRSAWV
jgi:hypothetical protein